MRSSFIDLWTELKVAKFTAQWIEIEDFFCIKWIFRGVLEIMKVFRISNIGITIGKISGYYHWGKFLKFWTRVPYPLTQTSGFMAYFRLRFV